MRRQLRIPSTARTVLASAAIATLVAPLQSCMGASQVHATVTSTRATMAPAHEPGPVLSDLRTQLVARGEAFLGAFEPVLEEAAEAVAPVEVTLRNQLGERGVFVIPHDGVLDKAAAKEVSRFFRCRRSNRRRRIDPGVLSMLHAVAREFPGREIEIVSAYRRPPYASRTSRHAHGRAIDLRVDGVRARVVRDFVWNLYGDQEAGVGFYIEQGFVHIDHREGESIAWTQRHHGDPYRYDPPWSRKRHAEVAMADAK